MHLAPDIDWIYRELVPIGFLFYHLVELLFHWEFLFACLPNLQEKIFGYFVGEDHYLRRVARAVDFSAVAALCAQRTPDHKGGLAPIPPLKLYKLYLVMFLLRIPSERELCRRAQADLAIRWFCRFGLVGRIPVHSTLSKFRVRMGVRTFEAVFHGVLCQCIDAKLLNGQELAFDASKMPASATAVPPHEQLKRLVRAFLEELFDTADVQPASQQDQQALAEVIQQGARLVRIKLKDIDAFWTRFREWLKPGPPTDAMPAHPDPNSSQPVRFPSMKPTTLTERLKTILARIPHARGDLDARYGHTSDGEAFLGYLSSFGIDTGHHVITATVLSDAGTFCSKHFQPLYAQHKQNLRTGGLPNAPQRGLGDKGYDEAGIRRTLADDGVETFIPARDRQNKHGVYSTDRFRFNEAGELICPGHGAMIAGAQRARKGGTLIYRCPKPDCILGAQCTKGERRTVEINLDAHRLRQAALEQRETPRFKDAMKRRLRVEAVFGHGKTAHHLDKALYRNKAMVRIQQLTGATSMNIEKLVSASTRACPDP